MFFRTYRLIRGMRDDACNRVSPTGLVAGQPDAVLLWHWRPVGHPSVQKLRSVVSSESYVSTLGYESCELGKHHCATYQS